MEENDMMRRMAFAFDRFIKDAGGNLDPRANSNKQRCALLRFWEAIRAMEPSTELYLEVDKCMRTVIKKRLTFHNFKSEQKYVVYDEQGEVIEQ